MNIFECEDFYSFVEKRARMVMASTKKGQETLPPEMIKADFKYVQFYPAPGEKLLRYQTLENFLVDHLVDVETYLAIEAPKIPYVNSVTGYSSIKRYIQETLSMALGTLRSNPVSKLPPAAKRNKWFQAMAAVIIGYPIFDTAAFMKWFYFLSKMYKKQNPEFMITADMEIQAVPGTEKKGSKSARNRLTHENKIETMPVPFYDFGESSWDDDGKCKFEPLKYFGKVIGERRMNSDLLFRVQEGIVFTVDGMYVRSVSDFCAGELTSLWRIESLRMKRTQRGKKKNSQKIECGTPLKVTGTDSSKESKKKGKKGAGTVEKSVHYGIALRSVDVNKAVIDFDYPEECKNCGKFQSSPACLSYLFLDENALPYVSDRRLKSYGVRFYTRAGIPLGASFIVELPEIHEVSKFDAQSGTAKCLSYDHESAFLVKGLQKVARRLAIKCPHKDKKGHIGRLKSELSSALAEFNTKYNSARQNCDFFND